MSEAAEPERSNSTDEPVGGNCKRFMSTSKATNSPSSQSSSRKRSRSRKNEMSNPSSHREDVRCFNEGTEAFWKNYHRATDWTKSQEIAYWRSRAAALEFENKMLRQQIMRLSLDDKLRSTNHCQHMHSSNNMDFRKCDKVYNPKIKRKKYPKKNSEHQPPSDSYKEADDEPQLKFEVTEEMKDFLELHMRHKMEQEKRQLEEDRKQKEAIDAAGEENAKLICQPLNFSARTEELQFLYGEAAPMIHGMETAIQLTFRRHCEKTGARLWPNIPLRL